MMSSTNAADDVLQMIEDVKARHVRREDPTAPDYCFHCDDDWPCDAAKLAARLEQAVLECADLRRELERRQEMDWSSITDDLLRSKRLGRTLLDHIDALEADLAAAQAENERLEARLTEAARIYGALHAEIERLRAQVAAADALAACIRCELIDGETWYGMDHANIVDAYTAYRAARPGPPALSLVDPWALTPAELADIDRWLDELGVGNPRHRSATITTLDTYVEAGMVRRPVQRYMVAQIVTAWGYPRRWHRFRRWLRSLWLET